LPLLPLSFIPIWVKYTATIKFYFTVTEQRKAAKVAISPRAHVPQGLRRTVKVAVFAAHVPHDLQGSCKNLLYDLSYLDDYAENVQIHKKKTAK